MDKPDNATEIPRSEFDNLARSGAFVHGPWISSFGDGDGDPYNPPRNREVRGVLLSGPVFAKGENETY